MVFGVVRFLRIGRGVLRCLSSSTLRGVCSLSFFVVLIGVSLLFGLRVAFIYCSGVLCLLPCSGTVFLFIVASYLYCCRLALSSVFLVFPEGGGGGGDLHVSTLLSLPSCCPILSCLSSPFGFVYFFVLPSLPLFCVYPLSCFSILISWGLFFFSFLCCLLRSVVCLYSLLPFLRCGGSPLSKFRVSLLACSVLLPHSLGIVFLVFCVFASVSSSFSPVRLLCLGFRSPYLLVGCSDVSSLAIGFAFFVSFSFLLICLSSCGSASIPQCFSCLSLFSFLGPCVVICGSPFSSSPFGSFALALGLRCLPCGSFATVGFFSFVFLGLVCGVSFLAFFPLATYVA